MSAAQFAQIAVLSVFERKTSMFDLWQAWHKPLIMRPLLQIIL
ncbi:MAG: hypothetical protein ACRBB2_04940 [Nitrosopumilus sp.]